MQQDGSAQGPHTATILGQPGEEQRRSRLARVSSSNITSSSNSNSTWRGQVLASTSTVNSTARPNASTVNSTSMADRQVQARPAWSTAGRMPARPSAST
eukprot:scaffold208152_cov17-Tisochrysis_lutea.AAC.2